MPGKKKKKKQDFQKVKLKVGRKLPRPTNETRTQFKVKTINIRSQFRPAAANSEDCVKTTQLRHGKLVDIKELLKHCTHRSTSFRLSAVCELCSLLESNNNELLNHLSAILGVAGELFTDDDLKIRTEGRKILKLVADCEKVTSDDVASFFQLLVAHLCCAMTHIHEDIRLDSLAILDILLERFPSLVASCASRLLPNFISLIAQPRQVRADASGHRCQKSSSLIVNPSSQMSTQKWRLRVLKRLGKFFGAVANRTQHCNLQCAVTPLNVTVLDSKQTTHCALTSPVHLKHQTVCSFVLRSVSVGAEYSDAVEKVQSWLHSLLPLVIDCWVEARSDASDNRSELSIETLSLLHCIVEVLQPLFEYIKYGVDIEQSELLVEWLNTHYQKKLVQHFLTDFPYLSTSDTSAKKRKLDGEVTYKARNFVSINLSLCLVMTDLLQAVNSRISVDDSAVEVSHRQQHPPCWLSSVTDYIMSLLKHDADKLNVNFLQQIFVLVKRLLHLPLSAGGRSALLTACCEAAVVAATDDPFGVQSKMWFDFLYKLIIVQSHFDVETKRWVSSLPRLLLVLGKAEDKAVTDVLNAVLKAGTQQHAGLLHDFNEHLDKFLDKSFLVHLTTEQCKCFVECFIWVRSLSRVCFQQLASRCIDSTFSPEVVRHLLGILEYRYSSMYGNGPVPVDEDQFFLLMFAVALRATRVDIMSVEAKYLGSHGVTNKLTVVCENVSLAEIQQQQQLITSVFDILGMLQNKQSTVELFVAFINQMLVSHRFLSLMTACSAALTLRRLFEMSWKSEFDMRPVVELVSSICSCVSDWDLASSNSISPDLASSNSISPDLASSSDAASSLAVVDELEQTHRAVLNIVLDLLLSAKPLMTDFVDIIKKGLWKDSIITYFCANIPDLHSLLT